MSININEIQTNDILSEISHYVVLSKTNNDVKVRHLQSGKEVNLGNGYVKDLLKTADQYTQEIKVGVEDKRWTAKQIDDAVRKGEIKADSVQVGDVRLKGIKTLWQDIHSSQVFTVCYKKQDVNLSKKDIQMAKDAVISKFQDMLDRRPTNREIADELNKILDQPILSYKEGDDRILRGYKVQFTSEDGRYDCVDMDITSGNNIRPVNINSIKWLVFDGVKYVKE